VRGKYAPRSDENTLAGLVAAAFNRLAGTAEDSFSPRENARMRAVFFFSPTIIGFMGSFDIHNWMHMGTMNHFRTASLLINNL
jgi:hypothetical protein